MWYNNKSVIRTHAKNGTQMAWAILADVGVNGWLRIRPTTADGVTNVFMILSKALANNRKVDVFIQNNQIEQVTLR